MLRFDPYDFMSLFLDDDLVLVAFLIKRPAGLLIFLNDIFPTVLVLPKLSQGLMASLRAAHPFTG